MRILFQDIRFGIRMLMRNPGFTLTAVLCLVLGIGANTAIFSIVNGVVLRPLPYKDADELVMIWGANQKLGINKMHVSGLDFVEWQTRQTSFEHIAAFRTHDFSVKHREGSTSISGARVSASLFPLMKIKPLLGRTFRPDEETPGKNQVAVISHRYWQNQFGADSKVIGTTIILDDKAFSIIGVLPDGFDFPNRRDIWLPVNLDPREGFNSRDNFYYTVISRLKADLSLRQAQEGMNLLVNQIAKKHPETNEGHTVWLITLLDQMVGNVKPILYVLLGAVGFVLLIACSNVANLLLARAATREREFAIRAAMGAGRRHVILQLLVESMLLALLGCALGLLLVFWSFDFILALSPWQIPRIHEIRIDFNVLFFALFVTLITGLLFGLAPAMQALRVNINRVLNSQGSHATGNIQHRRLRSLLVVGEVALALVLLIGAGLLMRSFVNLQNPDLGFDAKNLLIASVSLPDSKFTNESQATAAVDEFVERALSIPGVEQIGQASVTPFSGYSRSPIYIEGKTDNLTPASLWFDRETISPNYFKTLKIPIVKGRSFMEQDGASGLPVAIIDESLARRFWPNEDPVGQRFKIGRADTDRPWLTIVGVVGAIKQNLFSNESFGKFYLPYSQNPDRSMILFIRTAPSPPNFAAPIRGLFEETFGERASLDTLTLDHVLASSFMFPGFIMKLMGVFAGLALVMAVAGTYGVVACSVAQRTREIGIRMALGAQTLDIFHLVLRQGLILTLIGVGIGLAAAFGLTRFLGGLLIDITPTDPATFVGIALLLVIAAVLACYIPARHATNIDPMKALRYE